MRNIKLEIEYDGTDYCGWQVQRVHSCQLPVYSVRKKSIQEVIEKALQKILQEKVKLIASGRTDAGVHALAQIANFKTKTSIPAWKLQKALNSNLPGDIKIAKAEDVNLDFHSRFDAKSKIYRYIILNRTYPSAFLKDRAYLYPYPLDVDLMRKEAKDIVGEHDFKSFCASATSIKDTIRTIKKLTIKRLTQYPIPSTQYSKEPSLIAIDIEADGFLYNMVRNIVGTLIAVGCGRFKKGDIKKILSAKDRRLAAERAPAEGLYLRKVKY